MTSPRRTGRVPPAERAKAAARARAQEPGLAPGTLSRYPVRPGGLGAPVRIADGLTGAAVF